MPSGAPDVGGGDEAPQWRYMFVYLTIAKHTGFYMAPNNSVSDRRGRGSGFEPALYSKTSLNRPSAGVNPSCPFREVVDIENIRYF